MKRKTEPREKVTLIDRLAIAFISAVLAFFTGTLLWFLLVATFGFDGEYIFSSFKLVIVFTVLMALAGFFMLENFLAELFGHLWRFVYEHFRH